MSTEANAGPIPDRKGVVYAWRQLLARTGLTERAFRDLGLEWRYGEVVGEREAAPRKSIAIEMAACDAFEKTLTDSFPPIRWLQPDEVFPPEWPTTEHEAFPVFFWGGAEGTDRAFVSVSRWGIVIHADLLATAYFMLTRWEETRISKRDRHDRISAKWCFASKGGFLGHPVVDEYARILQAWIQFLCPSWHPPRRDPEIWISHDVDALKPYLSWRQFRSDLIHAVYREKSAKEFWRTVQDAGRARFSPLRNSAVESFQALLSGADDRSVRHSFFFSPVRGLDPFGAGYDLRQSWAKDLAQSLKEQGFEIGLHASYQAHNDPDGVTREREALESILGFTVAGGRHHYLRSSVPGMWRAWEKAGMQYDSSMGFADATGFRCGTCHPFAPFDEEQNREMEFVEYPLVCMDGTLRDYMNLDVEGAVQHVRKLIVRCRRMGGVFTFLWHNTSCNGPWRPWMEQVYLPIACGMV